ncbi:MAG: ParB/RepB/Spo0J family partition protein [Planctomycetia bacterium]|nr:ParB/RepB/Spo0J family partition protein [Planctomycetia bacterium]
MTVEKKSRLGRGLEALLGEEPPASSVRGEVAVATIEKSPFQPRKVFDDDEISSLSDSIRTHGILQPLVVRQVGDRYQLIAGERRLKAAEVAGLASVPVTIVDFNDQQSYEAALVENVQRTDLNPIEKALGFKEYLDRYSMTHEQLAQRLGLARPTITNLVGLLDLPEGIQKLIQSGQLTLGHAKVLKGITDLERQAILAREVVGKGLSVHALTALLQETAVPEKEKTARVDSGEASKTKTAHVQGIEDDLKRRLGLKVEIKVKDKNRGQIVLAFETSDDFERVVKALRR